ncbi:hypothetical protein D3C73_205290 [compost metagenome]|jgi:hypothetical protein
MQKSSAFNLMFDLDAMYDSRMGTLLRMRDDIAQILPLAQYRQRTMDDWTTLTGGLITTEAFNEQYARRDLATLKRCIITGMVPVLMNYIDSLKERFFRGVDVSSISVDINSYPYVIPGPIADTLQNCLRILLPTYVNVNMCRHSPESMTPTFLKKHYNGWITYDHDTWLTLHKEELLGVPINEVACITPKLFKKEPEELVGDEIEAFRDMDKHGLLELIMEDFLHIEHIPVSDFCFLLPRTYKLPDEEEEVEDPQSSLSRSSRMARSEASTD